MTWPIVKSGAGVQLGQGAWHPPDAITERYGVKCFPSVFVIDAAGVVRHAGVGGIGLDSAVATLLAEMEAKR